jgi:hypothetical protein
VRLADARLGDAQDLPDLGQGETLVVVEGDDDLLGLEHGHRVLGALVLQGVDQAEPVAALGADREQLVRPTETRPTTYLTSGAYGGSAARGRRRTP